MFHVLRVSTSIQDGNTGIYTAILRLGWSALTSNCESQIACHKCAPCTNSLEHNGLQNSSSGRHEWIRVRSHDISGEVPTSREIIGTRPSAPVCS